MTVSRELRDKLIEVAREMRSHPTNAERFLWKLLSGKKLDGFKFRRQHIMQTFIVDFYCPRARLIVEVDGEIHRQNRDYDQERDRMLREQGYRVIRFHNKQVVDEPFLVLNVIREMCERGL